MDEKQRKELAEKINREHKKDFEALDEFQGLLNKIYTPEQLKDENEKTQSLWKEIGRPDKQALFTVNINGYFLQQLYSIDPILRKFILYVSVAPNDVDVRAKISKYITREEIAEHIFYNVWYCFAMLQLGMGRLLVFDIVNALLEDYDYFEYVDTYWLISKIHGKNPPGIAELRQKLRRERKFEDADRHIHEKKRGTLTGATVLRTITEGDRKQYELEVEFFNEKDYEAVDDDFVDGYLCGGIALSFPGFSDRFFSQGEQLGTCDRLIIKCKGNSKVFDLSLLAKYKPAVLKNARKYNLENVKVKEKKGADRQTGADSDEASLGKVITPEIQAAMTGLAEAARSYGNRQTKTLSGHLLEGIRNSLSDEWKAASTTQDYERRLEEEEYQLKSEGIAPDSEIWKKRIGKFKKSKGRVSKSRLESSGGSLDSEIQSDQEFGTTFKDLLPSEYPVPEEMTLRSENKEREIKHENLMTLITNRHPELISKLMNEKAMTPAERKQLQRLRENKDLLKMYEEITREIEDK